MAVAIQIGVVNALQYREKDRDPYTWEYYGCWLVLKCHRKFLPVQEETQEEDESGEETSENGDAPPPDVIDGEGSGNEGDSGNDSTQHTGK